MERRTSVIIAFKLFGLNTADFDIPSFASCLMKPPLPSFLNLAAAALSRAVYVDTHVGHALSNAFLLPAAKASNNARFPRALPLAADTMKAATPAKIPSGRPLSTTSFDAFDARADVDRPKLKPLPVVACVVTPVCGIFRVKIMLYSLSVCESENYRRYISRKMQRLAQQVTPVHRRLAPAWTAPCFRLPS